MKARDYVKMYRDELVRGSQSSAAVKVGNAFMDEVIAMKNARHVSTVGGFDGILREQEEKWRAFVRLVGGDELRANGFVALAELWLGREHPELWEQVCAYRARKGQRA